MSCLVAAEEGAGLACSLCNTDTKHIPADNVKVPTLYCAVFSCVCKCFLCVLYLVLHVLNRNIWLKTQFGEMNIAFSVPKSSDL